MWLLRRFLGVWMPWRLARIDRWRAALEPGDRCWVVTLRGTKTRMTIHSRNERTVDLVMFVDPADGARCWMGVSLQRLFPHKPWDWEVEVLEEIGVESATGAERRSTDEAEVAKQSSGNCE